MHVFGISTKHVMAVYVNTHPPHPTPQTDTPLAPAATRTTARENRRTLYDHANHHAVAAVTEPELGGVAVGNGNVKLARDALVERNRDFVLTNPVNRLADVVDRGWARAHAGEAEQGEAGRRLAHARQRTRKKGGGAKGALKGETGSAHRRCLAIKHR